MRAAALSHLLEEARSLLWKSLLPLNAKRPRRTLALLRGIDDNSRPGSNTFLTNQQIFVYPGITNLSGRSLSEAGKP